MFVDGNASQKPILKSVLCIRSGCRRLSGPVGTTFQCFVANRIAWAWKQGYLPAEVLDPFALVHAVCLLEQFRPPSRAP